MFHWSLTESINLHHLQKFDTDLPLSLHFPRVLSCNSLLMTARCNYDRKQSLASAFLTFRGTSSFLIWFFLFLKKKSWELPLLQEFSWWRIFLRKGSSYAFSSCECYWLYEMSFFLLFFLFQRRNVADWLIFWACRQPADLALRLRFLPSPLPKNGFTAKNSLFRLPTPRWDVIIYSLRVTKIQDK